MKQTRREFIKTLFSAIGALSLGSVALPDKSLSEAEQSLMDGEWHHSLTYYEGDRKTWMCIDGQWYDPDGNPVGEPPDLKRTWYGSELTHCSRCGKSIPVDDAEVCWYCQGELCIDCWGRIGHCGHPEAHMKNYEAAHVQQSDESILTARRVVWSKDELGPFWAGDQYVDGRRVGVVGNYYDDIDEVTGLRYSREDQILMSPQYLCIHGQGDDCWRCGVEWAAYNYGNTVLEDSI